MSKAVYLREWKARNPLRVAEYKRRRAPENAAWQRAKFVQLRAEIIKVHGGACGHCGFNDPRALQIDHVHGGGRAERQTVGTGIEYLKKVLNDTAGYYQLLCANCNWIKRSEKGEYRAVSK